MFLTDIKPKGFKVIELPDYVDSRAVQLTKKVLQDPALAKEMVDHNYELGRKYFSFSVLKKKLEILLYNSFGV